MWLSGEHLRRKGGGGKGSASSLHPPPSLPDPPSFAQLRNEGKILMTSPLMTHYTPTEYIERPWRAVRYEMGEKEECLKDTEERTGGNGLKNKKKNIRKGRGREGGCEGVRGGKRGQ